MTIKPESSPISINGTGLTADAIRFSPDFIFFDRLEFSNARLRQAPEASNGQVAIIITLPGGVPAQISDGCVTPAIRPLTPDNPDLVFKRWDIKRWEIQGGPSDPTAIDTIFALHLTHKALLGKFEGHLNRAKGNVSYQELISMQSETFSYLITTGISMSGMAFGTGASNPTFTNILISSFVSDVDYEEPLNTGGTLSVVLRRWAATIEQRTLHNQTDSIF